LSTTNIIIIACSVAGGVILIGAAIG